MATKQSFVHLHFHTGYSLLDGICRIDSVMEAAERAGMPAVALTDHGVLYGAIPFYKKAKAKGIKPIIGCEVYVAPENMRMDEHRKSSTGSQSNHLVLLARDAVGYANLSRLVTKAHTQGFYYKPRIDLECLNEHRQGLIGMSACLKGEIPEMCVNGDLEGAVRRANEFADILGRDNFMIELQDHGIAEQRIANKGLVQVASRTGLPLVASNDVHYLNPGDWEAHDVMICLQTQSVMSDPHRMKYGSTQFYMKSAEEMAEIFREFPEALTQTLRIAERCNVDLDIGNELHFPSYGVPEGFDQRGYLIHLSKKGLHQRYGIEDLDRPKNEDEKKIADRFTHELEVIEKTGFLNYFLVVWDFIRFAREQGIPVGPGRGSGAGSIVAYALGITGIDPIQYGLIFERFLNPERVSPPDFDIDFCQYRRGEVIEYVKNKYGRENVAQIITFGTLGAKTVIRDIGRVLEIPLGECDKLAKMVPDDPGMTLDKALDQSPDFKKATLSDANAKRIMKYAHVLEGLPRNQGTHAAGVVIGEKPLIEILPLARDKDKEAVTQYDMKALDDVGLLKMDFLGLRTLTLIQEAVDHIRRTEGVELDIDKIPMDDAETFDLLNRGDTVGVFQVESQGMRDLLRRIGLTRFEDLIAMIALFRPGPMNMLDDFIDRKHGKVKIKYEHPLLESILEETYGVMLYQEQVQFAANRLAGFSLGQGDILRRAMGKKKPEEMAKMRKLFVEGCAKTNKIPAKKAEAIFANIERFAGYGFNKSHSAAYAVLSWQTAYLKTHYPVAFMSALLSSEINNSDKLPLLIAEAQQMGVEVLPPNVNDSEARFKPARHPVDTDTECRAIRFGLAGVKNVGLGAVEALVKERESSDPFGGLVDFCSRLSSQDVNKKAIESLVMCGAFDFTDMSRGRLFNAIEFAMNRAAELQRDRQSGQGSLFDMLTPEESSTSHDELPPADPWPESQMLSAEKDLLGFYISGHPLTEHTWTLSTYGLADFATLATMAKGTMTRIGGLAVQVKKRFTKRTQEPMAIFRLEHPEGSAEILAFPDCFRSHGVHLSEDAPIMVCGEVAHEESTLKLKSSEIYPLDEVPRHFTERVSLHIPAASLSDEKLSRLRELLREHPGEVSVVICLQFPGGEKIFLDTDHAHKVNPTHKLIQELERILGEESVYVGTLRRACKQVDNGRNGRGSNGFRRNGNGMG